MPKYTPLQRNNFSTAPRLVEKAEDDRVQTDHLTRGASADAWKNKPSQEELFSTQEVLSEPSKSISKPKKKHNDKFWAWKNRKNWK